MSIPFYSIVIPTRNRPETLKYSMQTVLSQSFSDFELIISDNSTDDATSELMKEFSDSRIKYFRTNGDLCMTDNWEFALEKVKGNYVLYFGDDDGIFLEALQTAHNYIINYKPDVYLFEWMSYNWPDQSSEAIVSDLIHIPFAKEQSETLNGKDILEEVIASKQTYYALPSLYYSFVSTKIIKKVHEGGKRFFYSTNPDIFSGIIISYYAQKIYKSKALLGIRGTSAKSNGAAFVAKTEGNKYLQEDFLKLNDRSDFAWHQYIPFIVSYYAYALESYIQFCEYHKISISAVNYLTFYTRLIRRSYFDHPDDPKKVNEDLNKIIETFNKNKKLSGVYKQTLNRYATSLISKNKKRKQVDAVNTFEYGLVANALNIDGKQFGVRNVLDLQQFLFKLTNK